MSYKNAATIRSCCNLEMKPLKADKGGYYSIAFTVGLFKLFLESIRIYEITYQNLHKSFQIVNSLRSPP